MGGTVISKPRIGRPAHTQHTTNLGFNYETKRYWDCEFNGSYIEIKKGRSIWLDEVRYSEIVLSDEVDNLECKEETITMFLIPSNDKEKIDKLQQFLMSHTEIGIDVSLVLSAPTKLEDMRTIYQNFSPLGIDTLIFTKLDETLGFGNIFSLVYETEKPVSYLSAGQEVPDDLMCADSDYLVECMLTGCIKKGEK